MKIKLLTDIRVGKEHGMTKGRVFDVVDEKKGRGGGFWVVGDCNELVLVHRRECSAADET